MHAPGYFKPSEFETYLRSQIDIVKLIGEYTDLIHKGRHYVGRCPFHPEGVDKDINVYAERKIFICMSSGCSRGDVFDFVAKQRDLTRKEAIQILAKELGIRANLFETVPQKVVDRAQSISFTMLKLYQQCPLRYKYRYIDGKRDQRTTSYLALGRILHAILADFFKIEPQKRSLERLLQISDEKWKGARFPDKEEEQDSRIRVEEMLRNYYHSHDCNVQTWKVEAHIQCSVNGLGITGIVDRIDELPDGGYEIIDYKTEQIDSSDQITNNMQLAFYYYGVVESFKLPVTKLTLDYLASQQTISMSPDESELKNYIGVAQTILQEIQNTEDFRAKRNKYCMDCVFAPTCNEYNASTG